MEIAGFAAVRRHDRPSSGILRSLEQYLNLAFDTHQDTPCLSRLFLDRATHFFLLAVLSLSLSLRRRRGKKEWLYWIESIVHHCSLRVATAVVVFVTLIGCRNATVRFDRIISTDRCWSYRCTWIRHVCRFRYAVKLVYVVEWIYRCWRFAIASEIFRKLKRYF